MQVAPLIYWRPEEHFLFAKTITSRELLTGRAMESIKTLQSSQQSSHVTCRAHFFTSPLRPPYELLLAKSPVSADT